MILYAVINGIPIKQPVRYAAVSLIASFGVDMAETIGWTKRSKRTVSATETAINSVTVFPISCAAPFRSPAPTACPMLTVVPIARPTIMTVSMCITCEPTETAVVLARPQTVLINSATVAKSRGGKKFFSCGHPQVLLSPPRAARKGACERENFDGFPHSRSVKGHAASHGHPVEGLAVREDSIPHATVHRTVAPAFDAPMRSCEAGARFESALCCMH